MLAKEVVQKYGDQVQFVSEDWGDSRLADRFGIKRYPVVFVNDVLVARPDDFGWFGAKGRYTPWLEASNHEKFKKDLAHIIDLELRGDTQAARAAGTIVSADIDNIYEGLPELLPLIHILISSAEFPHRLTGIHDPRSSLVELKARYGCPLVGMTLGTRGALLYCEGVFLESTAMQVTGGCRDTTGAGDAFHAGFLYGLLGGEEIEASLRYANATASLKCRALGARTSLPTRAELAEFIGSNPLPVV